MSEPPSIHVGGPMGVSNPPSIHFGGPMGVSEPPQYPPRGAHLSPYQRQTGSRNSGLGGGSEDLGMMLLCDGQLQGQLRVCGADGTPDPRPAELLDVTALTRQSSSSSRPMRIVIGPPWPPGRCALFTRREGGLPSTGTAQTSSISSPLKARPVCREDLAPRHGAGWALGAAADSGRAQSREQRARRGPAACAPAPWPPARRNAPFLSPCPTPAD